MVRAGQVCRVGVFWEGPVEGLGAGGCMASSDGRCGSKGGQAVPAPGQRGRGRGLSPGHLPVWPVPRHLALWGCCTLKRSLQTAFCGCAHVCVHTASLQSCLTLCHPMDCSPPGSTVCGTLQARTRSTQTGELPNPRLEPASPALAGGYFTTGDTWEALRGSVYVSKIISKVEATLTIHASCLDRVN